MSIGPVNCEQCSQRNRCSDRREGELFGCFDYCVGSCNKTTCNLTCPFNEPEYSRRMMEVNWYEPLRGVVPDFEAGVVPPLHLPLVFGRTDRDIPLTASWVAVPYHRLFREVRRHHLEPVATSPSELRSKFMLSPETRIAAISSAYDVHLERMWEYFRVTDMAAALKTMGISFATAPNFSFWTIAPRSHNKWNFRRTALFTLRLWEGGFRAVPHVYAERDADWLDCAAFFVDHPRLDTFAFELQTSDAAPRHVSRLRRQMALFLDKVGRPLRMVVSGGMGAAIWLPQVFPDLSVVEGDSYMKAMKRRHLVLLQDGKIRAHPLRTSGSLSDLLASNIRTTGGALEIRHARALGQTEKTGRAAA